MAVEHSQSSQQGAEPKRWVTVLIISLGLLVLAGLSLEKLSLGPSLRLATCFQDVNGLRPGARVRLAGVEIGTVRDVRAQPSNKTCPGAVEFEIKAPYDLRIPKDSVASTATAGLLGETYLEIDASRASGAPANTGALLPSKESVKFTAAVGGELKAVDESLKQILKQLSDGKRITDVPPPKPQSDAKPAPTPSGPSVPK
jgi:phospholipid/cholesterol/gamma-HCH transport system substrate-binding protein